MCIVLFANFVLVYVKSTSKDKIHIFPQLLIKKLVTLRNSINSTRRLNIPFVMHCPRQTNIIFTFVHIYITTLLHMSDLPID